VPQCDLEDNAAVAGWISAGGCCAVDVALPVHVGALARLQLGRAYRIADDHAKAQAACSDFVSLWKDADSDVPVLMEARKESATLKD